MALFVDIEKRLGNFHLQVKFEAERGILAFLGASGCGKSMTLKCIAGIETPDRGRIELDGRVLFDSEKRIDLPPQQRKVGYLFQQYALFPNMTVYQNLRAGCRSRENCEGKIRHMIAAMHLEGMEEKRPNQLSGGQQQRTALARILLNEPEVLLLDEPFSALDSHLRFTMEQELQDVAAGFPGAVLLVSHDRDEVFRLSKRIAVMDQGSIDCIGEKTAVFADPVTRNGAILTGCKNTAAMKLLPGGRAAVEEWGMELRLAETALHRKMAAMSPEGTAPGREEDASSSPGSPEEEPRYIGIRMHDIEYVGPEEAPMSAVESKGMEITGGREENTFLMEVVRVMENPFSYTILTRPVGSTCAGRVGWETDKETWRRVQAPRLRLHFPAEMLMVLK